MGISVALIDDDRFLCDTISNLLQDMSCFNIVGMAHDAEQGLEVIAKSKPDVVVLDLILPKGDGISILEHLHDNQTKRNPAVIILSAVGDDRRTRQAISLGAYHYMLKPVSIDVLSKRIQEAYLYLNEDKIVHSPDNKQNDYDKYISTVLTKLCVSTHLKGFIYLKRVFAVLETCDNEVMSGITKWLYPKVAKEFNTAPANVERSIRHAISLAWDGGMDKKYCQLLQYKTEPKKKPTNSAFIFSLSEFMKNTYKAV